MLSEANALLTTPNQAAVVANAFWSLLAMDCQAALYAEAGVRSARGFALELIERASSHLLPQAPDPSQLRDSIDQIFHQAGDEQWVAAISDESWLQLARALELDRESAASNRQLALRTLLEAVRVLSYRIAGVALDRELLRAEPALERFESPFLAQNAELLPLLTAIEADNLPDPNDLKHLLVLLDQCAEVLQRVRRKAKEAGISLRLTYLLARLDQLVARMGQLLDFIAAEDRARAAVGLLKTLVTGEKTRNRLRRFISENLGLLARNITDHASRQGEHYIAEDRAAWRAMLRGAAGGGAIIAIMAALKVQLSLLHMPPLTEGLAYGLNYALGFVLIHLLGFSVATKQPAMTAAAIAATLEEARPRDLDRLAELVRNVTSTQTIAILGNVLLALPLAAAITFAWPYLIGASFVPEAKALAMLADVHPIESGALIFAAVAGVGLFLSGIVSGFFDNRARYHGLAARISAHPGLIRLVGADDTARLGAYLDTHHGAILGNLFFGFYLGLAGSVSHLTGLPIDIRHVAFSSANLGSALVLLDAQAFRSTFVWAAVGVAGIAAVNLLVSFSLALYVAMRSRQLGFRQFARLGALLLNRLVRRPWEFLLPPK